MDFKDLLKATKEAKVRASATPSTDARTHTVSVGLIRRAKEDLDGLRNDYKNEVRRRVVFILPIGDGVAKFTELSTKEFGCFDVDAEGPYKDSIKNINPVFYTNVPLSSSTLTMAANAFQDVADEIGLISYPMVLFKNEYSRMLQTQQDLLSIVKEAFNTDMGSEIVGHYAIHKASEMGIEEGFDGKIMPVILTTNDTALVELLSDKLKTITNNVFVVATKENVVEKDIEKILTNIKKNIKSIN